MKELMKTLGPILIVLLVGACGATTSESKGATEAQPECTRAGAHCRWDGQCCSGRCYVDTGCAG
jgi:hypothetical protein